MNVLFICNQGKHRSKTAAELFKKEFATSSAGLYSLNPVTQEQLSQADIIMVMEAHHRKTIGERFPAIYLRKKIICLNISDIYSYNQPELISLLKQRVKEALAPLVQ